MLSVVESQLNCRPMDTGEFRGRLGLLVYEPHAPESS